MSSPDSALNGLASSAYFDLGFGHMDRADGTLAGPRILVVVFAIVLGLIAVGFGSEPSILWFGLKIMGYTCGGLLGVFILVLFFSRQADDISSVIAVFASVIVVVIATQWGIGIAGPVPWPWAAVIGMAWTIAGSLLLTAVRKSR